VRPVQRGSCPTKEGGVPIVFSTYQEARPYLIDCIGSYCSYCGMRLDASLAVEHVQPKSTNRALKLKWDNFLLACTNCNSIKKDKRVSVKAVFWPDRDNTQRAFRYGPGGLIEVNPTLSKIEQRRAQATIDLVGLDRTPDSRPNASDRRWLGRQRAWERAHDARRRLLIPLNNTRHFRSQIIDTAKETGFWPIWFTVFEGDRDMTRRLIKAFPGTAEDCFDTKLNLVLRPGGIL
jgi:uncharacterized protein (TIGR02646 family)